MDAIEVKDLNKAFRLPHEKHASLKQTVLNFRRRSYEELEVLKNINFSVKKGEFFGIVGRNGSGKSTLLKLLAGIYTPTSGKIAVNGHLTPFIELGVGFNPELTGRDNVFLNGTIFGMSRKQIREKYNDIVAFAELEKFMDQKLKNYSSGMQVRLAFSIAIRARSDMLLIDEVLAVGDAQFQAKCYDYFRQIKGENQTVVFVSHDMSAIKDFCDRAVLIESGRIKMLGDVEDISSQYLLDNSPVETYKVEDSDRIAVDELEVKALKPSKKYLPTDELELNISYRLARPKKIALGIAITRKGTSIAEMNTKGLVLPSTAGTHRLKFKAKLNDFLDGAYGINIAAFSDKKFEPLAFKNNAEFIAVQNNDERFGGNFKIEGKWLLNELKGQHEAAK